jgi:hypothetical protein
MKKILEVLQYGDVDIRFNTDFDPVKNPNVIPDVIFRTAFAMITRLWGGNEQAVLAMIRSLAIADLAVSVNRKEMLRHFDEESAVLAHSFWEAKQEFEKKGGRMTIFPPGMKPSSVKN